MKNLENKNLGILWIGDIPDHWKIESLCNVAQIILSNADKKSSSNETKVFLCNYTDVYYNNYITLNIDFIEATATDLEIERFQLKVDDVLITKDSETPNDIAIPSLVVETKKNLLCGYHLSILRPIKKKLDGNYLFFLIMSECMKSQFSSSATGITRYGIGYKHIKNISICLPPLETQKLIARFLNCKTAAIDTLIAKKQRLIQLLEEKRTALINQAVTKGLNPNTPMKDSGIPWIGEIPEHWSVKRVKTVINFITSGSRGWAEYYTGNEEDPIFLQSGNLGNQMQLHLEEVQHARPPKGSEGERAIVKQGDVLVCVTGARTGNIAIVREILLEAYINQHLAIVRPITSKIDPCFLGYALKSKASFSQFLMSQYGGTKQGLGLEDVKDTIFVCPPLSEQSQIVSFLDGSNLKTNYAIRKLEFQIEKLQEYRRSLITAAVTGKLKIEENRAA